MTNKNKNDNTNSEQNSRNDNGKNNDCLKVKRARKSVPRESCSQRSSVYRGVTRHRWTGRYEAHLWDKNSWNEPQNKKGKQVYLGAYDDEQAAAHTYDLAALKYWGPETILNFSLSKYEEELKEMEGQSREEYIGSLRRKSSGFSRGVSKYRGVARHHHNGRWEARIGRVFGNKYLYLGTYATQEEAAMAYDMAAIQYRGPNAVTNFDLSRYLDVGQIPNPMLSDLTSNPTLDLEGMNFQQYKQQSSIEDISQIPQPIRTVAPCSTSALDLLLQSPKFNGMIEGTSAESSSSSSPPPPNVEGRSSQCSFPDDIQTYFECNDSADYTDVDHYIFGDLEAYASPIFQCELLDL